MSDYSDLKIPSSEILSHAFDDYLKHLSERENRLSDRIRMFDSLILEKESENDLLKVMIQDLKRNLAVKNMQIQRVENNLSKLNREVNELRSQINIKDNEIKNVKIQASYNTSDERFRYNGDGTVIDNKTGLMWKIYPEGGTIIYNPGALETFEWDSAMQRVAEINRGPGFAGYHDWRLPDIEELKSIVDNNSKNTCINHEAFKNTRPDFFWSSSSVDNVGNLAWAVYFSNGNVCRNYKNGRYYVRLVRGGNVSRGLWQL